MLSPLALSLDELYVMRNLSSIFPWNACDQLFLSHQVALRMNTLLESLLILNYHEIFPSERLRRSLREKEEMRRWKQQTLKKKKKKQRKGSAWWSFCILIASLEGESEDSEEDEEDHRDDDGDPSSPDEEEGGESRERERERALPEPSPRHSKATRLMIRAAEIPQGAEDDEDDREVFQSDLISLSSLTLAALSLSFRGLSWLIFWLGDLFSRLVFLPILLFFTLFPSSAMIKVGVKLFLLVQMLVFALLLYFSRGEVSHQAAPIYFWLWIGNSLVLGGILLVWAWYLPQYYAQQLREQSW